MNDDIDALKKRKERINSLLEIINNFRSDELELSMDEHHVERWLKQFDDDSQDVILQETINIFQNWYCNRAEILKYIQDVIQYLKKQYGYETDAEVFKNVSFPSCSLKGMSQGQILQMLKDYSLENAHQTLLQCTNDSVSHFVYIDDGIYTGKTACKEITSLMALMPKDSTLDAFFLFGCSDGIKWAKYKLLTNANDRRIKLDIFPWKTLTNSKTEHIDDDGQTKIIESHLCLWPSRLLSCIPQVRDFERDFITSQKVHEFHPYRESNWTTDKGVFINDNDRLIVEREFLLKGIELIGFCKENSGMLPLGFDRWPSFGLGSFCATDLNISNTAPLVLWWGNVEKNGSVLDRWYPLLPRRIGGVESDVEFEMIDWADYYDDEVDYQDGYNTCPDCGCSINDKNDGGNGFCCFCAWKH